MTINMTTYSVRFFDGVKHQNIQRISQAPYQAVVLWTDHTAPAGEVRTWIVGWFSSVEAARETVPSSTFAGEVFTVLEFRTLPYQNTMVATPDLSPIPEKETDDRTTLTRVSGLREGAVIRPYYAVGGSWGSPLVVRHIVATTSLGNRVMVLADAADPANPHKAFTAVLPVDQKVRVMPYCTETFPKLAAPEGSWEDFEFDVEDSMDIEFHEVYPDYDRRNVLCIREPGKGLIIQHPDHEDLVQLIRVVPFGKVVA